MEWRENVQEDEIIGRIDRRRARDRDLADKYKSEDNQPPKSEKNSEKDFVRRATEKEIAAWLSKSKPPASEKVVNIGDWKEQHPGPAKRPAGSVESTITTRHERQNYHDDRRDAVPNKKLKR